MGTWAGHRAAPTTVECFICVNMMLIFMRLIERVGIDGPLVGYMTIWDSLGHESGGGTLLSLISRDQ